MWCHSDDEPGEEIEEKDFLNESLALAAIANKDFFLCLHPSIRIEDRAKANPYPPPLYTGVKSKKSMIPYDTPKVKQKEVEFPDEEYLSFALLQRDRGAWVDKETIPVPKTLPNSYSSWTYLDPIPKRQPDVVHSLADPRAHPDYTLPKKKEPNPETLAAIKDAMGPLDYQVLPFPKRLLYVREKTPLIG